MPSPLEFNNTEKFRKVLVARNLPPYPKSPIKAVPPINYETILRDLPVIDSPDKYIDEIIFANQLYVLNQYGKEGGYQFTKEFGLNNTKSNEGEYGFDDANIKENSVGAYTDLKKVNYFYSANEYLDAAEFIDSLDVLHPDRQGTQSGQPYPSFVFSMYSPLSILLSDNPQGSDGSSTQDSFLMQLAVKNLKKDFEERIARKIEQETIARANFLNINDGLDLYNILSGNVPLVSPDWTITKPANPVTASADFALRLGGSVIPFSPIPGSYFDSDITLNPLSGFKKFKNNVRKLLTGNNTGSELFFNNTGEGQKSALFFNLRANRYRPNLDSKFYERIFGENEEKTINGVNYYVGSPNADPGYIQTPSGEIPLDDFGNELASPVYGPDKLGKLYEGEDKNFKFGFAGKNYSDGGNVESGFSWVSPKYKDNAGKKVGVGGRTYDVDPSFNSSSFQSTESTNYDYTDGSILDDIQRIVNSQPSGAKRLEHVGNAIDQVSKVFNDGYKEITKGSKVLRYEGAIGNEVGMEYCRLFTKDTPYLNYGDLQKTDGITKNGRKIAYSVLDNTYNLNIYPVKPEGGQDSTNIMPNQATRNVKKYMLSLENLSWRTSNTPGYTVSDLPVCERGPNDGRIMWFPPYDLKFNEDVQSQFNETSFIGRPEPVYTYAKTSRSGSLSFKIIVDHPSILNLIVNKVLANETNKERINNMLASFFAGCLKYDLYELAKKYNTANPNDLKVLQTIIEEKVSSEEVITYINQTLNTGNNTPNNNDTPSNVNLVLDKTFEKYNGLAFYFNNDVPFKDRVLSYDIHYQNYVSEGVKATYNAYSPTTNIPYKTSPEQTSTFFTSVVENNFSALNELFSEVLNILESDKNARVSFSLFGTASQPQTIDYNLKLGNRRIESVKKWLNSFKNGALVKHLESKRLAIVSEESLGEGSSVTPVTYESSGKKALSTYNCTGDGKQIFTIDAMACRATTVKGITVQRTSEPIIPPKPEQQRVEVRTQRVTSEQVETQIETLPKNITKKILRLLLSECDYFEAIKEETPMVYDNLRDKLKFFDPAFHSMTPEGLNSRLTFLQQCLRPGDTIPTIVKNGKLEYNNARNTAFGAPPVLVLRIGDFYHTKIIPKSLGLTFEGLDLNPEGIGVQPMIANVTLGFSFIGGNGIKTAVDKLQNALSFNYYANTEVYDDRAEVTDDSLKVIDTEFYELLKLQTDQPAIPEEQINSNNSGLIGKIVSGDTENGLISYSYFMDTLIDSTRDYFIGSYNAIKSLNDYYNHGVRQQYTNERNYILGYMADNVGTNLFGKPVGYSDRINNVFDDFIKDIENENELFLNHIKYKVKPKMMRVLKSNYKKFINTHKQTYLTELAVYTQKISDIQLQYYKTLTKLNILLLGPVNGSDGYKDSKGNVVVYDLSATTNSNGILSSQIVIDNKTKLTGDLNAYYSEYLTPFTFSYNKKTYSDNLMIRANQDLPIFYSLSDDSFWDSLVSKRTYLLLSNNISDDKKYGEFKNALLSNILSNINDLSDNPSFDIEKTFDDFWLNMVKPKFLLETRIARQFMDQFEKTRLNSYFDYKPFNRGTEINFTYSKTEGLNFIKNLISSLNYTSNVDNNKNYWNINDQNNYITKAKLL